MTSQLTSACVAVVIVATRKQRHATCHRIYAYLLCNIGITQKELAAELHVSKGWISKCLGNMSRAGYRVAVDDCGGLYPCGCEGENYKNWWELLGK